MTKLIIVTISAFIINLLSNVPLTHQQELDIIPAKCKLGTKILNDCNWCTCGSHNGREHYSCRTRDCAVVDPFGHFNDAIQNIHVGMEGHGAWRSRHTACEPNVHYKSKNLYCICNEDGYWPHPVCRDQYRVFYNVRPLKKTALQTQHRCVPYQMYLIGCNACLCPSDGMLDFDLCTKKQCHVGDPVLHQDDPRVDETVFYKEVYTTCAQGAKIAIGCHKCTCLGHNHLVCRKCPEGLESRVGGDEGERLNYCSSMAVNHVFNVDCNLCFCDARGNMLCTVKTCLGKSATSRRNNDPLDLDMPLEPAKHAPHDLYDCTAGTEFLSDCNTCRCQQHNGSKVIACTMKPCYGTLPALEILKSECVLDTYYESACYICTCNKVGGVTWQICELNWDCVTRRESSNDLEAVHGYCRPLHVYKNGCNPCRCLDDGKVLMCTTQLCDTLHEDDKPEGDDQTRDDTVEVIPVTANYRKCPSGRAYKIDCNMCFCLPNGNTICTTNNCRS